MLPHLMNRTQEWHKTSYLFPNVTFITYCKSEVLSFMFFLSRLSVLWFFCQWVSAWITNAPKLRFPCTNQSIYSNYQNSFHPDVWLEKYQEMLLEQPLFTGRYRNIETLKLMHSLMGPSATNHRFQFTRLVWIIKLWEIMSFSIYLVPTIKWEPLIQSLQTW